MKKNMEIKNMADEIFKIHLLSLKSSQVNLLDLKTKREEDIKENLMGMDNQFQKSNMWLLKSSKKRTKTKGKYKYLKK